MCPAGSSELETDTRADSTGTPLPIPKAHKALLCLSCKRAQVCDVMGGLFPMGDGTIN